MLALVGVSQAAWAEPLRVEADTFELLQDSQQADFSGHVHAVRDDMTLESKHMTIWYEQEEKTQKNVFKKAKATGNVRINTADTHAIAEEVTLFADSDVLILKGAASIDSPQGKIMGEYIKYNINTKNTEVMPGEKGGKARFVFEEKKKP